MVKTGPEVKRDYEKILAANKAAQEERQRDNEQFERANKGKTGVKLVNNKEETL